MSHIKMNFAEEGRGGTTYSLVCENQSSVPWVFYVYQTMPNQASDIFSLAWFASPFKISTGSKITFTWEIDYSFVWGNSGVVTPGVNYEAGGSAAADLNGNNQTTFNLNNNAPNLTAPTTGGQAGSLTVNQASDVPNSVFSTGIGMSGQGSFVQQALANAPQVYTPNPMYWIAAATEMQMGVVLAQTTTQSETVAYPTNVFTMYATLSDQQLWSVSQTAPS